MQPRSQGSLLHALRSEREREGRVGENPGNEVGFCVDTHVPRFEALTHVCLWSCVLVFVKCFSSFSWSLRIISVVHLFLDRLRINSVVHLFLDNSCCVKLATVFLAQEMVSTLWHSFTDRILAILCVLEVYLSFFCSVQLCHRYIYTVYRKKSMGYLDIMSTMSNNMFCTLYLS